MTQKQLVIMWVGILVAGAMFLYPPYRFRGYHSLFSHGHGSIDMTVLLLQWFFVAVVAGAAMLTTANKPQR